MPVIRFALVVVLLFGLGIPTGVEAATQSRESRVELARRVEERAAATSFPALEAFGEAAMSVPGREGLNRCGIAALSRRRLWRIAPAGICGALFAVLWWPRLSPTDER